MEFVAAAEYGLDRITDLLGASFEGYIVSIPFSVPMLLSMMRTDAIDLEASRVIRDDGRDLGIALIARRGWESRIAAYGIIAEARGRGLGRHLLDQLVTDAKSSGERRMVLECIDQNEAALRLYEGGGFRRLRHLVGFTAQSVPALADPDLRQVHTSVVAHALGSATGLDLPWQISPASTMQMALPNVGYQLGPSYAIINPGSAGIQCRAIVTPVAERGKGHGRRLIQAISARHPGLPWSIPPVWPEVGNFLTPLGFNLSPISQWLMELQILQ